MSKSIYFVTGNVHKLEETTKILLNGSINFPFKLILNDIDLPEYQGEPDYIAKEKCKLAAQCVKGPVIVEDVSLCFNALNGMPGPYIKSFLTKIGNRGLVSLLQGYCDKSAYALCTFAYSSGPDRDVHTFEGRCDGKIVEPRGDGKFGWDPIFLPDGHTKTYAEMSKDDKNKISHRSRAIAKLKNFLTDDKPE